MNLSGIDSVIHAPKRLMAMAVLANTEYATFQFLKEQLALSDSDLSKQMSALESAGYIKATKRGRGPGSTTTYTITRQGTHAYQAHRAALFAMLTDETTLPTTGTAEPAEPA
ncbi:transcriptional regulator [Oerskovia paurometabola]|uniref:transcriptional regulator n=1 Tax=Oerskovia paurometabola TaxID=162170 RepID=UPI00380180FC